MQSLQKNSSNQFPEHQDLSGQYTKSYADICFLLSAEINEDRALMIGNFLNKHYFKVITPNNLKQAFELYITDKLDDYLVADRNGNIDKTTYNKIDPALIQKVVKAYRLYMNKIKPKEVFKALSESSQKKAELEDYTINSIMECYNTWVKKKQVIIHTPQVVVNELKECDLYIERVLTDNMLKETQQKLKYSNNNEKELRTILRGGISMENLGLVDRAENVRMIESIKASFESIVFNEINLQDELDSRRVYKVTE